MELITGLIIVVFGVLQIILFFKIWGMTNDVKRMAYYLERMSDTFNRNNKATMKIEGDGIATVATQNIDGFSIGDLVVDKNDNQWRIVEINYPIIKCKSSTKGIVEFDKDEIKRF